MKAIFLFLLFLVSTSSIAQKRSVEKQVLVSDATPAIKIKFNNNFHFAGKQSFILYNNSTIEQFYFVNADGSKNISSVYTVQFESYLPGNNFQYNYKIKDSFKLGANYYLYSEIFNQPAKNLQKDTSSDASHRWRFLLSKGYHLPADAIGYRFIRLLDLNRRSEILIIYHEDLRISKVTEEELDKDENKLKEVLSNIFSRARKGFLILP